MTTVTSTVDRYVVVKLWCILQAVATGGSTYVFHNHLVGHCVGTVGICCNATQVFNHGHVWQITTCIICYIRNSISCSIQLCFVVQALAWLTARSVAYYSTGCVYIVASVC